MSKMQMIPLDYDSRNTGLWLLCKYNKISIFRVFAVFETGSIEQIKIKKGYLFDESILDNLYESLLNYDFSLSKQVKAKILKQCNDNEKQLYKTYLKIFCR